MYPALIIFQVFTIDGSPLTIYSPMRYALYAMRLYGL